MCSSTALPAPTADFSPDVLCIKSLADARNAQEALWLSSYSDTSRWSLREKGANQTYNLDMQSLHVEIAGGTLLSCFKRWSRILHLRKPNTLSGSLLLFLDPLAHHGRRRVALQAKRGRILDVHAMPQRTSRSSVPYTHARTHTHNTCRPVCTAAKVWVHVCTTGRCPPNVHTVVHPATLRKRASLDAHMRQHVNVCSMC